MKPHRTTHPVSRGQPTSEVTANLLPSHLGRIEGMPLSGLRARRTTAYDCGVPTTLEPTKVEEPDLADDVASDRPWVVLVWNDPVNLMSYVTHVFQKLFGYSLEKATELMMDVHEKGRAAVATGTREEAEMHVFRLHEHTLWATMEHDK